jgi:hypothetical protein
MSPAAVPYRSGLRKVVRMASGFRVVCAHCGGGGGQVYASAGLAAEVAVRRRDEPCHVCGACKGISGRFPAPRVHHTEVRQS